MAAIFSHSSYVPSMHKMALVISSDIMAIGEGCSPVCAKKYKPLSRGGLSSRHARGDSHQTLRHEGSAAPLTLRSLLCRLYNLLSYTTLS